MFISGIGTLIGLLYLINEPKSKRGRFIAYFLTGVFSIFGLVITIITIPELKNYY